MRTTKVNRIELSPKDSNLEICIGHGTIYISVLPDGKPEIRVQTDPNYTCGNAYLNVTADVAITEYNPDGADKYIKDETVEYPNAYNVYIEFPAFVNEENN